MTTQLSPLAIQHFTDNNGNLLAGGQLYTYAAGTSTPLATYTDSTGGTPNANPVIMNARGEANVWTTVGLSYKFVLKDAYGVTIWTVDNITDGSLNSALAAALSSTTDPTKGVAMVGFLPAGTGAVGRTTRSKLLERVSVEDFGAIGGTHDDTAAFQLALNYTQAYGGALYAEQPLYTVSGLLTRSSGLAWSFIGGGKSVTEITTTNTANASILSTTSGHTTIKGIKFSCTGTPVAGTLLQIASDHILDCVVLRNYYNGASLSGNVGIVRNSSLGDEEGAGPQSTNSIGFLVNGYAGGLVFDNVVGFVPIVTPAAGVKVLSCGAFLLSNCNIIGQNNNLILSPGNGQVVASVQAVNSFFDSAQSHNIVLSPDAGGTIVRTYLTQCECSSASSHGILLDSTSGGTIDGVLIVSAQANLCGANGITVLGANTKNIDIVGGQCAGNAGSGLSINGSANNIRVTALISGAGYGLSGNNTGIYVDASASAVKLTGCVAQGNSVSQISDGASSNIIGCVGHSNGVYSNFGDGLKVQFGSFTSSSTPGATVAVTFSKAFTTCVAVFVCANNASSADSASWIDTPSATGFNGHCALATVGVQYLAIGI